MLSQSFVGLNPWSLGPLVLRPVMEQSGEVWCEHMGEQKATYLVANR